MGKLGVTYSHRVRYTYPPSPRLPDGITGTIVKIGADEGLIDARMIAARGGTALVVELLDTGDERIVATVTPEDVEDDLDPRVDYTVVDITRTTYAGHGSPTAFRYFGHRAKPARGAGTVVVATRHEVDGDADIVMTTPEGEPVGTIHDPDAMFWAAPVPYRRPSAS